MSNTPAIKFRDGSLQVVVWRNTGDKGTYYTVSKPTRGYKRDDDSWAEADSFNEDDLLPLAELLREAKAWIRMQKQADAKARKEQAAA